MQHLLHLLPAASIQTKKLKFSINKDVRLAGVANFCWIGAFSSGSSWLSTIIKSFFQEYSCLINLNTFRAGGKKKEKSSVLTRALAFENQSFSKLTLFPRKGNQARFNFSVLKKAGLGSLGQILFDVFMAKMPGNWPISSAPELSKFATNLKSTFRLGKRLSI